jgi:hypothetical protein
MLCPPTHPGSQWPNMSQTGRNTRNGTQTGKGRARTYAVRAAWLAPMLWPPSTAIAAPVVKDDRSLTR